MKKIIIKNVYSSIYKMQESKLNGSILIPDVEVKFTIIPFSSEFMSYVEFEYFKIKTDKEKTLFEGNSLWSVGSMDYKSLIELIDSYESVEQIINDFNC